MLLLTSCVNNTSVPIERKYVSADIIYSEADAQYGFRLNMDSIETQFAQYFFESSIEHKEREACIETTDYLLSSQLFQGVTPEIYIFTKDRFDYKYIDNHKLFSSIQDWKSVGYITDVLLVAYGEYTHYGTVFGYANYLIKSNKWGTLTDGKFSLPGSLDILDLNYLCFDENFASLEDINIAKEIACDFVDLIINQSGEKAIKQILSSYAATLSTLWKYYMDNGISYVPSPIRYSCGGKSYDYVVYSNYGTFYIANNWIDTNAELNPLITEGFLHSNYAETKIFFETNFEQMKQYQELFALDSCNNDLNIIFANTNLSQTSFYQSNTHTIYVKNVDSLMHEYIHALTQPTYSLKLWEREGFARYFSYYYDFYGMPFLNQDYNNSPNTPELKYIQEYLAKINRPIDMAKDYCELENIAVYYFGFTDPNKNYLTGSSFVQYLVKQYGEKAVINSIYGNGEPLPKTYTELKKEWNEFIEANYNNYSKYE